MTSSIILNWCTEPTRAQELAVFFARNIGPEYISHGELQSARALSPDTWRENLPDILRQEIEPRLCEPQASNPGQDSQAVLIAEDGGVLVGLALVSFTASAPIPFVTVEDMIVDQPKRGHGIGTVMMKWIAEQSRARNITRLFIESGMHNERAHHFYLRNGFNVTSLVMMQSLV